MATASIRGKKRSFEAAFKLEVVQYAEKSSNREAGRKFNVDEKCVRQWKLQKVKLLDLRKAKKRPKKRLPGGGGKPRMGDLEEHLIAIIDAMRERNLRVTCKAIQLKARELYASCTASEASVPGSSRSFVASRGWLRRFLKRWDLSVRRKTTVGQRLPADIIDKVVRFIIGTRKRRIKHKYSLSGIGNMDETPVWMDMPGDTTITRTGVKSVPILTTGHEKARFTVCLAAMADGTKLKPFIVFKGVRQDPKLLKYPGVVVTYSRNGWMNEQTTKTWIEKVWGTLSFQKRLLIWDAYKCHITDSAKASVKGTRSDTSIIPGGLTKHLQPADVSWNKPFKEAYRTKYEEWLTSGDKTYTAAGNMRAPEKILCVQWVKESWNSLSTAVIVKSFETCGISVKTDGSQDSSIHCLKDTGVATAAKSKIEELTKKLTEINVDDVSNPFDDLSSETDEDDDELENNEIIVDDESPSDESSSASESSESEES